MILRQLKKNFSRGGATAQRLFRSDVAPLREKSTIET